LEAKLSSTTGDDLKATRPRFTLGVKSVLALIAFVAVLAWLLSFIFISEERRTDDAYVTGHLHTISSRVSGTVEKVLVDDNQFVHAGQVLVQLDTRDFDVNLSLERSRMEQARAEQERAHAAIVLARAAISAADADVRKSDLDFARAQELSVGTPRALSQQEFDAFDAARTSAHARQRQATAQLDVATASLGSAQAIFKQGEAGTHNAMLQQSYTSIISPTDGYVGRKTVETGQRVEPGQGLLSIVEPNVWVVANFRETQLRHVSVGDTVKLELDAVPDVILTGHVDSFAPATGAQFALLPPDNATGNFTKVIQRVPVKILIKDHDLGRYHLFPGLSVVATLQRR
jgi:membrane fusion protein (multidrug efflux system)